MHGFNMVSCHGPSHLPLRAISEKEEDSEVHLERNKFKIGYNSDLTYTHGCILYVSTSSHLALQHK